MAKGSMIIGLIFLALADICHQGGQGKDKAKADDDSFIVVALFWKRLFPGNGHLNLIGRDGPFRPVPRAGATG